MIRFPYVEFNAMVGFIDSDDLPPLMGRTDFFNRFEVCFKKDEVIFRAI